MLALSSLLQRTAAIVAAWAAIFIFSPAIHAFVREGAPESLRYIDLWFSLRSIGGLLFGVRRQGSPEICAAIIAGVAIASVFVLARTVRAVEVSR